MSGLIKWLFRPLWRRVWARIEARVAPLEVRISATEERVAATEASVAHLEVRISATEERVAATEASVAHLEVRISATEERVAAIETRSTTPECSSSSDGCRSEVRLFVPPGHFYSPVCNESEAAEHLAKVAAVAPTMLPGIEADRDAMAALWRKMLPYLESAPFPDERQANFRYYYNNPAFSWGDASILHAMIRLHRPRRIVEVGSGWSSACTLDTIDNFLEGDCEFTLIDPFPDLAAELVGPSRDKLTIVGQRVQDVDLTLFERLEANDILFIDSTHVLKTGSDVCFELFEILPRLSSGVIVHFHDMFWPFEYPHSWAVDENRSWNELQAMRAFLYENSAWEIMWFTDFMTRVDPTLIKNTCPRILRSSGGALWLKRR